MEDPSFIAVWRRIYKLTHLYLIGLGSNQPHPLIGNPTQIIHHAIAALEMDDIDVFAESSVITSAPMGPSLRCYANAAAVLSTTLEPSELLMRLHDVESHFGRIRRGQRWGARTLDLDIILWSGGIWASTNPDLSIPHPAMRQRNFVLTPAAMIVPDWRDPLTGLSVRQLQSRFNRPKRLDPAP
ncbi:MAG: 2-amino-4-hydroxy-6-hydroxymethyldihydropteridine diphosphokinase [Sphingorhabdus sp.]|uniref:2-amino-4-hydroxy-6- hydroxymethyldihydropteridine diphosphokinase n=1 Tax=Sphingorhabdus sp. TaxID=1902408 RepID=UPI0038FC8FAB